MSFSSSYETPLSTRYASKEMAFLFSPKHKYLTWRTLWIALAKGEKKCGLPISSQAIRELEEQRENLDKRQIDRLEKQFRHDVFAHIEAYGQLCPSAHPILHLGATSAYVTDNADLIIMKDALRLLSNKLLSLLGALSTFAHAHASLPCLAFTHLQPAQPTTVGKRACLWLQDLLFDTREITHRLQNLPFLGAKGATGSQASFLALFDGDLAKVDALDRSIAQEMGFSKVLTISSQTYPRKLDQLILSSLTSLATSAHKMATDIRLLVHLKELQEPFASTQVGSSAMPHKRNPIRSERICSLARYLISLSENPTYTAATQWLERTLDDSANRRCSLPEAFLTADALLNELYHLIVGLTLNTQAIENNLAENLPTLSLEMILMEATKKGLDRQATHDRLRKHVLEAEKKNLDLLDTLAQDPELPFTKQELTHLIDIQKMIGAAPAQVARFLKEEIAPLLASHTPTPVPNPEV